MSRKGQPHDPFAGYTPVKVAKPVVDNDVPDLPPGGGKPYHLKRRKKEGDFSRTLKMIVWLGVSVVLVALIAAVAYGFFYEKPVEEKAPELSSVSDEIRPLAELGQKLREDVRSAVSSPSVSNLLDRVRPNSGGETNKSFVAAVLNSVSGVTNRKQRVEASTQKVADADSSGDGETDEGSSARQNKPAAPANPPPRTVDPSLKRFYSGGRQGKKLK